MSDIARFDGWLQDEGPAALVLREWLQPVDGADGVVFPATFAANEDSRKFAGGYNIDRFPDGSSICLLDSVGSQANRIEPLFGKDRYRALVPDVRIRAGDHEVSILEAGHRAADAVVRCSELRDELRQAFEAALAHDALPLAKLAPTSIVFGVWDSRETQAKLPRLVSSTIRAFDVLELTRSAQYVPALDYVGNGVVEEPADTKGKKALAERGFAHVPSSAAPGGIIARGGIRRDAVLSLAALRPLSAKGGDTETRKLQRYILGLALVAFSAPAESYLRQGCMLVADPARGRTVEVVQPDGSRAPLVLSHAEALEYAKAAAADFVVGKDRRVEFDATAAREELALDGEKKKLGKKEKAKK